MRFRPEQHLRRQSDIRAVRERGSRIDCRAFTFWCRPRDEAGASPLPRVGVVASTAAVGGAVFRNRAKRRLREIFRKNQHLLPPEYDLLLVSRAAVTRWPFTELEKKFIDACRQLAERKNHA